MDKVTRPPTHRSRIARWALKFAIAWLALVAVHIDAVGRQSSSGPADAAIVLGAAVYGDQPSPVFRERIRHAISLYRGGQVRTLIFTGGYGEGARHAESQVASSYAVHRGVPRGAILIETSSRTTRQNIVQSAALLRAANLRTVLIVSDPLHLKRALRMAADLGIDAEGAPTPTTLYKGWLTRGQFLLRELYYYHQYLLLGT